MALLGNLFTIIFAIMVVVLQIPVSLAGFALNFASLYGTTVTTLVHQYTKLELDINAAERIMEFATMDTETESGIDAPAAWPPKGAMQVQDLVVKYEKNTDPVLKDLSFSIKPQERLGVVGRTRAGKSSLTLALFRILEAVSGSIIIDELDISKVKFH